MRLAMSSFVSIILFFETYKSYKFYFQTEKWVF
jgi:hypothetical protein